ncbi:cytochrome P450 [Wolfiporia cocos MD-104 SS10]|uniref:Cytochrome P450 n=1 Tax=Wolfiporia cocos (strain MD-104) TaxID=742152 RepID=A0A2H3IW36_WOLCO|nr:cytochrome P450 [Wolfiporia cocos MD-104 SS10]
MDGSVQLLYAWAAAAIIYVLYWRTHPLYSIPTIGSSAPLLSYLGAWRYFREAREILQEGYSKHKVFKVALLEQWLVVVSGSAMNEELRKIPDSHVSFMLAADEFLHTKLTIAPDVNTHPIHIGVIRGPLTRNLGLLFADVVDEIKVAFSDVINPQGDDWIEVPVLATMAQVVSRASNRVFVGLPLCRNTDYLETVVNFAFDVAKGRDVLSVVPGMLKGLVGKLLPWSRRAIKRTTHYLAPTIQERLQKLRELGEDWNDRPDDYLMWVIDEANKTRNAIDLAIQAILVSNFAAIHTSSNSITHALYHLAANPEYIQPLREEVEAVTKEYGWTKAAVGKMYKLDSFMRESQRLNGIVGISVMRKVLQDVTLSDGTLIPKGTLVAAAAAATHVDEEYYDHPDKFDPFRFSDKRLEESERVRHQYINTSAKFVAFGHGKHACPGRFFAVNELKVMMAYMVLNYDIKFKDGVGRPDNIWIWHSVIPADVKVMFRKRQVGTM